MEHRNVRFSIDIIGVDTWRWTVFPAALGALMRVGQSRGTREQAIADCKGEIDSMLAREQAT
jgi:hypothetical protein